MRYVTIAVLALALIGCAAPGPNYTVTESGYRVYDWEREPTHSTFNWKVEYNSLNRRGALGFYKPLGPASWDLD